MRLTERVMRTTAGMTADRPGARECPELLALDWASLGRLVQARTLQAVAAHFATIGASTDDADCGREESHGASQAEVSPDASEGAKS